MAIGLYDYYMAVPMAMVLLP